MNFYMAIALFSIMILIYWVITEVFTIMFRFTGLPDERARFQVMSLLTGCGYTTKESEMFLSNRSRRRVASLTMLFGYVFNITIVSAFINVFISLKVYQVGHYFSAVLFPVAAVAIVVVFMRVPAVRSWADRMLEQLVNRMIGVKDTFNIVDLMDYIGKDSIATVTLNYIPEEYQGVPLSKSGLKAETGIIVMVVERAGEQAEIAGADTVFKVGDKLTVFGKYPAICRAFHARERFMS